MNVFDYRKVITHRRLKLAYTSPAICEADFSATGSSTISLQPLFVSNGPTGLIMEPYFGGYRLRWNRIPGALCYSIYRLADELNPFSPYILVAECIDVDFYDVDDGTYCITAITPEGETECSNSAGVPPEPPLPPLPPYVPEEPDPVPPVPSPVPPPDIPGTCGDGTPPVPDSFLEPLDTPEIVLTESSTGSTSGSADFTVSSGRYAVKWVSGYVWDHCYPTLPVSDAFIRDCWFVYEGDITVGWSKQYGCYTTFGTPPDCSPSLVSLMTADYPDGIMADRALTFTPTDPRVGNTATFVIPGSVQAGGCSPAGGTQTMQVLRTHAFITQPSTLTIQNYAAIKHQLGCGDGTETVPQWSGVIDDSYFVSEGSYQCYEGNNGEYIGSSALWNVDVRLSTGSGKWIIQIFGDKGDGPAVFFAGEKRYGQTAQGNYGRTGGCSTLGCLTLV